MFKKIMIAALAVGLGLFFVKGPGKWAFSHVKLVASNASSSLRDSVKEEKEIARLKMELQNLAREDDQHYDKVARMMVKVDSMQTEVDSIRANLKKEESRLRGLHDELSGARTFVMHGSRRYTKDDLRNESQSFMVAEENLKSKEANLEAKRKHLAIERGKLTELRTIREKMATDLQKLETSLAEERHAEAASKSTIDVTGYSRWKNELDRLKERIEVRKTKRILRGELTTTATDEKARERDAKADKYLDERFGGKTKASDSEIE